MNKYTYPRIIWETFIDGISTNKDAKPKGKCYCFRSDTPLSTSHFVQNHALFATKQHSIPSCLPLRPAIWLVVLVTWCCNEHSDWFLSRSSSCREFLNANFVGKTTQEWARLIYSIHAELFHITLRFCTTHGEFLVFAQ